MFNNILDSYFAPFLPVGNKIRLGAASFGSIKTSAIIVHSFSSVINSSLVTLSNYVSKELLCTIVMRTVICYMKLNVCGNFNVKLAKSNGHLSIVEMSTSSSSQSNILSSVYPALYAHPCKASISQAGL